jgi:hypothetical protein
MYRPYDISAGYPLSATTALAEVTRIPTGEGEHPSEKVIRETKVRLPGFHRGFLCSYPLSYRLSCNFPSSDYEEATVISHPPPYSRRQPVHVLDYSCRSALSRQPCRTLPLQDRPVFTSSRKPARCALRRFYYFGLTEGPSFIL